MSKLWKNLIETQESPRMTESEYQDFLKKQKIDDIKIILSGIGFALLWVMLAII